MRINADTIKYFEDLLSSYKAELEHLKSYKAEWDSSDKDRYNNLLREANNTSQFIKDFKDKEWPPHREVIRGEVKVVWWSQTKHTPHIYDPPP